MILLQNGKKYMEEKFKLEDDFEKEIIDSYKQIFGNDSIYIDAKKKIGTDALGETIPDGFLFNMVDPDNRDFYLVEFELEKHDFFKHIFPQVTKFFAFFKNSKKQKALVEKLFAAINTDASLKSQFKKYLGEKEIYKFLNDIIDSSQNILLVIDGDKPELPEITDTYSDTWGKMVKILVARKYVCAKDYVLTVHPEFENIEFSYEETPAEAEKKSIIYSEEMHLEGVNDNVKEIYSFLKEAVIKMDNAFIFNPQKYYISIKGTKNVVFIKFRKKKIRMVVMLPEADIRLRIANHSIKSLSEGVQKFYNGPCAVVEVHDLKNIDEIIQLLQPLILGNSVRNSLDDNSAL